MYQLYPPGQMVRTLVLCFVLPGLIGTAYFVIPRVNITAEKPGIIVDSLDGVYVYNNGPVSATHGRNLSEDGYNIGLKYQCVEFVKRYYLYHYDHRMPDSYGHAKDFFDKELESGVYNHRRGLNQYHNGVAPSPEKGDLVVFRATIFNRYGHVAIVSAVTDETVEIIQQNPGRRDASRQTFQLIKEDAGYRIMDRRLVGFLRILAINKR